MPISIKRVRKPRKKNKKSKRQITEFINKSKFIFVAIIDAAAFRFLT
jgi:hypothetical protein